MRPYGMTAVEIENWVNARLPNRYYVSSVVEHGEVFHVELSGPSTVREFNEVAAELNADMTLAGRGDDLIILVMFQIDGFDVVMIRHELLGVLKEAERD